LIRKVCVVVTARPSYSRIRSALAAISAHEDLELQLVLGASAIIDKYGAVIQQVERDGFSVDARVQSLVEGENPIAMARTVGLATLDLASTFDRLAPDVVVSIADRYETLATAITAALLGIPLAHVQGGELTGSIDDRVRHTVTKLADLHLVASETAAQRVLQLGEEPHRVFVTGCPSIDIAASLETSATLPFDPFERYGGVGPRPDLSAGYLVVLQHPVTDEHRNASRDITETLDAVLASGLPALWFWPNPDAGADGTSDGIRRFREHHPTAPIHFFKNMAPTDFLQLLVHAVALVGNSSVGIRECAYLGVPVVNVGSRQQGRDRGRNVHDVAHEAGAILSALQRAVAGDRPRIDTLYGDGTAGKRVAEVLASAPLDTSKRLVESA
jgi:UDP-hydrolysing UDP-N-acetyl-D-glucosamine 2-epimerase